MIGLKPGQGIFSHLPQGICYLDPLFLPELGPVQHLHHRVVHGSHQSGGGRLGEYLLLVSGSFQQDTRLVGIQMVQQMQIRLLVDLLLDLRQRDRVAETHLLRQLQFLIAEGVDAAGPVPLERMNSLIKIRRIQTVQNLHAQRHPGIPGRGRRLLLFRRGQGQRRSGLSRRLPLEDALQFLPVQLRHMDGALVLHPKLAHLLHELGHIGDAQPVQHRGDVHLVLIGKLLRTVQQDAVHHVVYHFHGDTPHVHGVLLVHQGGHAAQVLRQLRRCGHQKQQVLGREMGAQQTVIAPDTLTESLRVPREVLRNMELNGGFQCQHRDLLNPMLRAHATGAGISTTSDSSFRAACICWHTSRTCFSW